jgi:osmoprotectant transport system ATP-binding protein
MIELQKINKSYGSLKVVQDFSLTISAREITVLIGPSGCGKTTTLEMINGLVKPDSGKIFVGGEDVETTDLIQLRRKIGYVIQEMGLFPHFTVYDNIALVPRLLKWDETRIRQRINELLELVNILPDRLNKYPAQLSGGQQQRVGVARALAADPEYLLMDEPFSAIDPINRSRLQDEFLRIQRQLHKTVVFVTHDMDEALKLGDRVAVLHQGRLVQYDTPIEILHNPEHEFVSAFVGKDRFSKTLRILKVRDILDETSRQYPSAQHNEAPENAVNLLEKSSEDYIFWVNREGNYLGYSLKTDLAEKNFSATQMRSDLDPVTPDTELQIALENLLRSPLRLLPLVHSGGKLFGQLTLKHLQNYLK